MAEYMLTGLSFLVLKTLNSMPFTEFSAKVAACMMTATGLAPRR